VPGIYDRPADSLGRGQGDHAGPLRQDGAPGRAAPALSRRQ